MSGHEQTIRRYWQCAEERDWSGFAEVLSPDVVYDMSQTRERVIGRDAYVRFNQEYPGDWHLALRRVVADDGLAHLVAQGEQGLAGLVGADVGTGVAANLAITVAPGGRLPGGLLARHAVLLCHARHPITPLR